MINKTLEGKGPLNLTQHTNSHPSAMILLTKSLASRTLWRVARTVRPFLHVWTLSEKVMMLKWSASLRSPRMVCMACFVWLHTGAQECYPTGLLSSQAIKRLNTIKSNRYFDNTFIYLTCFIFVPIMEPLTSMTNMTSLGTTGRPRGAK